MIKTHSTQELVCKVAMQLARESDDEPLNELGIDQMPFERERKLSNSEAEIKYEKYCTIYGDKVCINA